MTASEIKDDNPSTNDEGFEHKFIEGEKKPWSEGTVHIFWPSAVADETDDRFVAWCREHAKGELKKPDEILPLDDETEYTERFCKTCLENAKNAKNIPEPKFLDEIEEQIDSEIESSEEK